MSEIGTKATDDLLLGTTFASKYKIISVLGFGGMSVVYKAEHLWLNNLVAIKMLQSKVSTSSKTFKRFQQEAQAIRALDHPNIVSVFDFGLTDDGQPFLIMDFLEGVSLANVIKEQGRLPVNRALHILTQAVDAVGHAHNKGIIHRDLKPSNVMLVNQAAHADVVKIVDFGIAKLLPPDGEASQQLTQTGEIVGSPLYMSPEQCTGQTLDARSDIYLLGCVMYEALTGKPPLKASTAIATLQKQMTEIPEALTIPDCDKHLLAVLDAIVFKAIEKDPDKRYSSAAELSADLRRVKQEAGAAKLGSVPNPAVSRFARRMQRLTQNHPVESIVCALSAFAIIVALSSWASLTVVPLLTYVRPPIVAEIPELPWLKPMPPISTDQAGFAQTEHLLQVLCESAAKRFGFDSPEALNHLKDLVDLYVSCGDWAKAARQQEIVWESACKKDGVNALSAADAASLLADCYFWQGKYDHEHLADLYENVIDTYSNAFGNQDSRLAVPLTHLAEVLEHTGLGAKSRESYERAVAIFGRTPDDQAPEYAMALSRLGDLYRREGRFPESQAMYKSAYEKWKKLPGMGLNQTLCEYHMAQGAEKQHELDKAANLYRQALAQLKVDLGTHDRRLAAAMWDYSDVLWQKHELLYALSLRAQSAALAASRQSR